MAMNLGRGGVVNTQPDSSQLLSTGAIFRQQAEQNTKAQAGLILQDLKAEADNRGWSMRRMAEMYPDQFKAASAAMLGGGTKGLAGADKMWAETIGGMESEEQYMQYAKDRDFVAANPEGTPYVTYEKRLANSVAQATGQATDPTVTTPETEKRPFDQLMREMVTADPDGTQRDEFVQALKDQIAVAENPAELAKLVNDIERMPRTGPESAKRNEALLLAYQGIQDGTIPWVGPEAEANLVDAEGKFLEKARQEEDAYMKSLMDNPAGMTVALRESRNATVANQYDRLMNTNIMDDEQKTQVSDYIRRISSNDPEVVKMAEMMNIDGMSAKDFINQTIAKTPGLNADGAPLVNELSFRINMPTTSTGGNTASGAPMPTLPFETPGADPVPEEGEGDTPAEPKYETSVGGMVGYQAERDKIIEQGASPANKRYQEILTGRGMEATIEKEKALTTLYGAQEASALGNLELAYASAGSAIDSLEGRFDKVHIDSAKQAYADYTNRLLEDDVPTPPARTIDNSEEFGKWFDGLRNNQQRAYVDATSTMAKLIPGNPALASSFRMADVDYKTGLFNFGGTQATVIVPSAYNANASQAMTSEQFVASLMEAVNK